jgi:hypothetical protein
MITRSKQNWEVGQTVKVGFMQLRVVSVELTPGDYRPDIYHLENLAGTKSYQFTPHFGLVAA